MNPRHSEGMGWMLAMLSIWFGGAPAAARAVEDVRVSDDRIVVRFDEQVGAAAAFLLGGPDRIAVDIDGAVPGGRRSTGGPVAGVRLGARGADGARIVFDLAEPAVVTGGRFSDHGRKLTINLRRVDPDRFLRATTAGRMRFSTGLVAAASVPVSSSAAMIVDRRATVSVPVPARRGGIALPRVQGDADRPLVVIDAGHGGHDPGAISPHSGAR
ncbi:AMIN domain-containing protein, partial [Sphingomonas sp. Leaf25]|uniref:AMIN domain-containing protein n=1 Tax=Sphingomonas sp. Leaf25 TaxID=1735692 RepID=UPI002AA2A8C5